MVHKVKKYKVGFLTPDGKSDFVFVNAKKIEDIPKEVRKQMIYRKVSVFSIEEMD